MTKVNDLGRRENYVGEKYLIEEYKDIQKNILKTSNVLKNFGMSSNIKDSVEKTYYDTDDMFFCRLGITICTNTYKGRPYTDLVVRYEDGDQGRIKFISDIPDTFIRKIGKKESIAKHYEYISSVVLELIPNGISVEPLEMVRRLKPKLKITKKRERFRVINSIGLKVILSFDQCVYSNVAKTKVKLNILELRMDSPTDTAPLFEKFVHDLQIAEYRMIKTKDSDLFIGQDYLDI
ncbi:MAG: hypothetical protein IKB42_05565 [Clostridia bacterium]|nr:hypothetical protein [Clostridia bacterium]